MVVKVGSTSDAARKRRRAATALRASQSATYVPYRHRGATSVVRVATALLPRERS
ncbi:MAG: hypothetical protein QOI64_2443 [Solirubrobacteraceae bacterium]|jgi:hypothetical protein|nr:hypothetical protein [Solirubrobacteraceae bacterium]